MFKRILLFIGTNILVIATISIMMNLLGVKPYLTQRGIDYRSLLLFCAIWGMAGSFISLWISKFMAKMAMGVRIINPREASRDEQNLITLIYRLAQQAGLKVMPEVGIYDSPELNAFATGPTRNDALVAVSTGLVMNMNQGEVEAVLGHEISHVANGDMVTMTLVQGVVNAFSMFLSRIIAFAISSALSRGDEQEGVSNMAFYGLTLVFDILFTLLGSILVAAFSRWREYRADAGGARLTTPGKMIAALQRLGQASEIEDNRAPQMAAFKINTQSRLITLLASHPSIPDRIARLQNIR